MELNLGRDAFDRLKYLKKSESDLLKSSIKVTFNEDFNLGLTEDQINLKKTSAMQKFGLDGISFYLTESFQMATRAKTSRIIGEVTTSFDLIRSHLTDNNPTSSVLINYDTELEGIMESMRLDL